MINMTLSDQGVELLKQLEGYSAKPYRDSAGKWTVGYGHLMKRGDGVGGPGDVIDDIKATSLLKEDVQIAVNGVNSLVTSNINQNQFDALVIFTFNLGVAALANSTLLHKLNAGDIEGAADEFVKWNKVHTPQGRFVELAGLTNRRKAEQELFETVEA